MPIKVMLFDLWGTLFADDAAEADVSERRSAIRIRMASDALRGLGITYDDATIASAFAAAGDEHARVHAEGLDLSTEGRTVLYMRHLDPALLDRLDDDGWRRMHEAILTPALSAPPGIMPGARDVLLDVKALGLPIGLISNAGLTPGVVLRRIMDTYGLLEHFDHTIFSDEVELAKPTEAIFAHALDAFGVEPAEAAFLGDQPVLDVLGPRNAGIWSIQIGSRSEDGIEPHARIAALGELVPALRALGLVS
ncbi:MAG TPA: HAD family hydrolase [Dehalococcoidia bacterium]|nr:HAD family hydrolase [Dehalococcoidia bacterium]